MPKKKATFQPTVRPDWAGAMEYISETEQSQMFQAILMFPAIDLPNSAYWNKTIKPDLQNQYETFISSCKKKEIGVRKRWENTKGIDMNTNVIDNYTDVSDKNTDEQDMKYIVKDKDKNKDKDVISKLEEEELKKITKKETETDFERFWQSYVPIQCSDGRVVAKGSKKEAQAKFERIIKAGIKAQDIIDGAKRYLSDCQKNDRLSCGVSVFLNQERWKDDWGGQTIKANCSKSISHPDYVGEGSFLKKAEDDPFCADL